MPGKKVIIHQTFSKYNNKTKKFTSISILAGKIEHGVLLEI